jgi:integrase
MPAILVKKKPAKANNRKSTIPKLPEHQATRARQSETIKFLTLDETRRLFAGITKKRDKAIFLLAYRHGLRASEIGLLRVSDLDLKRLRVMLQTTLSRVALRKLM